MYCSSVGSTYELCKWLHPKKLEIRKDAKQGENHFTTVEGYQQVHFLSTQVFSRKAMCNRASISVVLDDCMLISRVTYSWPTMVFNS